jgi:hypothetical protein
MKKFLLFLLMSILASTLFAQYGTLTISSNQNQKFWLFIDDVLQNEYATHIIRIQGLQYNYYKIRVEIDNYNNNCVGQTILISNVANNNNYVINSKGNAFSFEKTKMMVNPYFIQNIILPDYSYYSGYNQFMYPGFNNNVNYGQGAKGNAYKRYPNSSQGYGNQGYGNQGYGNQGYGNQPPHGNPPGYGNTPPPPHGNPGGGSGCMNTNDFNRAYNTIKKESFENSKLETAKQITATNWLCVSQIMQICKLFSFENSKLEYAKFAYRSCVDKNNYYQLNDVFSFSASKDELRNFINN